MRLTRHNSKAPANAQDPGLVTIAQLTVLGANPADVAAFTAESRLRHIEYTRSEGLYCPTCAAAQFDLNADRETCRACLQPTRPAQARGFREHFSLEARTPSREHLT